PRIRCASIRRPSSNTTRGGGHRSGPSVWGPSSHTSPRPCPGRRLTRPSGDPRIWCVSSPPPAPRTIVHCGRLFDGTGRAPAPATLVLARGHVEEVHPPGTTPERCANDLVVDGTRHTVMPGLMDLHVHLQHGVLDPREPHLDFGMLLSTPQLLT